MESGNFFNKVKGDWRRQWSEDKETHKEEQFIKHIPI